MATIATTTDTAPFIYPSTTYFDRDPNTGYLYCMTKSSTATWYTLYRSTDNGGTWAAYSTLVRANIVELGPIFIGTDSRIYFCYRTNESSQDRIYFQREDQVAWGGEVLVASAANGGSAGSVYTGMDLAITMYGGNVYVAVAVGTVSGGSQGVTVFGVYIDSQQQASANSTIVVGTTQWLMTGSGRITPAIDFEHQGDNRTAGAVESVGCAGEPVGVIATAHLPL